MTTLSMYFYIYTKIMDVDININKEIYKLWYQYGIITLLLILFKWYFVTIYVGPYN
jgi:hypothetical protein